MRNLLWKALQEAATWLGCVLLFGTGVMVILLAPPIIAALLGHF